MQTDYGLSARRADRVLALSRSARCYRPRVRVDSALIAAIEAHLKDDHESLKILIDSSLPSVQVIRALNERFKTRGALQRLRLANGPEFISTALKDWARQHGVTLVHIQPGKPTQNAYIERFNRTFRTEVLDRYIFTDLAEVRRMAEDWCHRYNHHCPHRALGGLPLVRYSIAHLPKSSIF